jgi:hypothetical protein
MYRDRDVRNAIKVALVATGAFDPGAVWLTGLPENYGQGASQLAAADIRPVSGSQEDPWDSQPGGGLVITGTVRLTFLYRHDDPQLRDEGAELLLVTAANALNGQPLIPGLIIPPWTRFRTWQWPDAVPPEQRIIASFEYRYEFEGWAGAGTDQ